METFIHTEWSPAEGVLRTRLAGILRPQDVQQWSAGLEHASQQIPPTRVFAMLVDIRGYEVSEQSPEVHRVQREIIPAFLARHGFEVGFFRLFEISNTTSADPARATCIAAAHVHHDRAKMELYNQNLGTDRERFFCDPADADAWLRTVMTAQ